MHPGCVERGENIGQKTVFNGCLSQPAAPFQSQQWGEIWFRVIGHSHAFYLGLPLVDLKRRNHLELQNQTHRCTEREHYTANQSQSGLWQQGSETGKGSAAGWSASLKSLLKAPFDVLIFLDIQFYPVLLFSHSASPFLYSCVHCLWYQSFSKLLAFNCP